MRSRRLGYFEGMAQETPDFDWDAAAALMPRVAPPCPYYGSCGGCRLQQYRYEDQVALKERRLQTLFTAAGITPESWLAPITGQPFGYRTRLRFSVKYVPKKGGVLVGFHERKKTFIMDMDSCRIVPEKVSASLPLLKECLGRWSNPRSVPQVSVSASDEGDGYCFRVLDPLTEGDREALRDFARRHGARVFLQTGGYETIVPLEEGESPFLGYRLEEFGLTLRYRNHHFTQVNHAVNHAMLRQAIDLLKPRPEERGLDLFCGVGNFTLALGASGAGVLGMDSEGDQIDMARDNAALNHLAEKTVFEPCDLYTAAGVAALPWDNRSFVLLDPPRTGAEALCRALPADGRRRLLYVSCNPETLARDAGILVNEKGLRLEALGLLDMSPQTLQAEAMALFTPA